MSYTLTLSKNSTKEEHVFITVQAAITLYEVAIYSALDGAFTAKFVNKTVAKGAWIFLYPGMCAVDVKEDWETDFQWSDDDRLKIRPYLKEQYRQA
jgi:hypothetical protein